MKAVTYKEAGVDIDTGNAFVRAIKPLIQKTKRPEVLTPVGGFAGLFSINRLKYEEPVLVSCTDGVGTKIKIAQAMNSYTHLGQDLVAMCVNDLLCVGAEPLFFLDYYACGQLKTDQAVEVVGGMAQALESIQCALIGGETAEMPGVYRDEEFDLAGFAVGVVNRPDMVDASGVSIGHKIIGLASSGVHANGFSLVRKIINDQQLDLNKIYPNFEKNLGDTLLTPTLLYVNPILKIKKTYNLLAIAHITGGGLLENLPRVLPKQTQAILDRSSWKRPTIFEFLQEQGNIQTEEMDRVFNNGIGLAIVVENQHANEIAERLTVAGYPSTIIGEVAARKNESEPQVKFVS